MFKKIISKLTTSLILLNLFFLQSYLIRFKIFSVPTNLQEILIVLTFIAFLISIIVNKKFLQTLKNIPKHWIILSFIFLTILSIVFVRPEFNLDFIRHAKFLFFAVIFTFIFLENFSSNEDRKKALIIGGLGAILFGIFSVIYNLSGANTAPDFRLTGPLDAAVYLAYYLAPFLIFFAINFIENPGKKTNLYLAIILSILIIATRSMGTILGIFLVLTIYLFKKQNLKFLKNRLVKIFIILVGTIIILATFFFKIYPSFQTKYTSLNERNEIWTTSIYLLKEPKNAIFGLGFGQFQETYNIAVDKAIGKKPLDYQVLQPHNIFLLFIFQYGILGLVFIIFCFAKLIQNLSKPIKSPLSITIFSSFMLLYFFLHGLIDTPFFKNDLIILLVLFMELSLVFPNSILEKPQE